VAAAVAGFDRDDFVAGGVPDIGGVRCALTGVGRRGPGVDDGLFRICRTDRRSEGECGVGLAGGRPADFHRVYWDSSRRDVDDVAIGGVSAFVFGYHQNGLFAHIRPGVGGCGRALPVDGRRRPLVGDGCRGIGRGNDRREGVDGVDGADGRAGNLHQGQRNNDIGDGDRVRTYGKAVGIFRRDRDMLDARHVPRVDRRGHALPAVGRRIPYIADRLCCRDRVDFCREAVLRTHQTGVRAVNVHRVHRDALDEDAVRIVSISNAVADPDLNDFCAWIVPRISRRGRALPAAGLRGPDVGDGRGGGDRAGHRREVVGMTHRDGQRAGDIHRLHRHIGVLDGDEEIVYGPPIGVGSCNADCVVAGVVPGIGCISCALPAFRHRRPDVGDGRRRGQVDRRREMIGDVLSAGLGSADAHPFNRCVGLSDGDHVHVADILVVEVSGGHADRFAAGPSPGIGCRGRALAGEGGGRPGVGNGARGVGWADLCREGVDDARLAGCRAEDGYTCQRPGVGCQRRRCGDAGMSARRSAEGP